MRRILNHLSILLAALVAVSLTGCGFQLKQDQPLPFADLTVVELKPSLVAGELRRRVTASYGAAVLSAAPVGAANLQFLDEQTEKQILSLSGAGRVREFQLRIRVNYQLTNRAGALLIEPSEINLSRTMSYSETAQTAKEQEEAFLYADMRKEASGQILRRIASAQPRVTP